MRDHFERLVFIDETSLKTNMTKASGWAPVGSRLIDHAPAGRWNTQTFIAGLRHESIDALQADLDAWLHHYNFERTHQGKMCCGRTPVETMIDGKQIWQEKFVIQT